MTTDKLESGVSGDKSTKQRRQALYYATLKRVLATVTTVAKQ